MSGLRIEDAVAGVRTEQTKVREELVANQNEMRTDFSEKHAENKRGSRSIRRSWSNSGDGAREARSATAQQGAAAARARPWSVEHISTS